MSPASAPKRPPSRDPHACPTCKKVFSRKEYVRRHQRLKHIEEEPPVKPFPCSVCDASFSHVDKLDEHLALVHDHSASPPGDVEGPVGSDAVPLQFALPSTAVTRSPTSSAPSLKPSSRASISPISDHSPPQVSPEAESNETADRDFVIPTTSSSLPLPFVVESHAGDAAPATFSYGNHFNLESAHPTLNNPEDLSHLGFFASPFQELNLQLLLDSCQSPGQGNARAEKEVRATSPTGPTSPYHIRARANIGTPEDWAASDKGLGRLVSSNSSLTGAALSRITGSHPTISNSYFAVTQTFCIGYKSQWEIPPLPKLSRYASLAAAFFVNAVPVVHKPTMFDKPMTPQLAFALAVAGAGYDPEGRAFHDEMVHTKRHFAIFHLHELDLNEDEYFSVLQSGIIYNVLGLYHKDPTQRKYSQLFHEVLIKTLRANRLLQRIQKSNWETPVFDATADQVERSWREWIQIETWKRLSFLIFILDLQMSNNFGATAALQPFELAIDLPAPSLLWSAPTARSWHALLHTAGVGERPPSFLALLDAVLCLDWPAVLTRFPNGNSARLIPRLGEMEPLALSVVVQTLLRLERQLEKQILTEGSARGTGASTAHDGRDPPEVALKRVKTGLRLLQASGAPGADRRKSWFSGVKPLPQ